MNTPMRIPYTACPLCEAKTFHRERTDDCTWHPLYRRELPPSMTWLQCDSCGHGFTDGYFTPEAAALVFAKTQISQQLGHEMEGYRPIAARMVETLLPYVSEGSWLDVGFGNGALLFAAQEYGFKPIGVDLRADNVAALAKLGIEAHATELGALKLDKPCAVISLADVLEHMPFPKDGLKAVHGLLADGGVALISMPNSESMVWRKLNETNTNPYWGELEHYHNFGRKRLYGLLQEMGFEPLKYGVSERYRACMQVIARKAR